MIPLSPARKDGLNLAEAIPGNGFLYEIDISGISNYHYDIYSGMLLEDLDSVFYHHSPGDLEKLFRSIASYPGSAPGSQNNTNVHFIS